MMGLKKYSGIVCLVLMLVFVPIVVYRIAIRNTVQLNESVEEQREQLAQLRDRKETPIVKHVNVEESVEISKLMSLIQICTQNNDVLLSKYTPYITAREHRSEIVTSEVILKGGFIPTVRVLHFIETSIAGCRVVSANFNAKMDRATQNRELITTILIQQISQQP